MDARRIQSWIDTYIDALETTDANAFAEIFSEDATYKETDPFDEYRGKGGWQNLTGRLKIHERYDKFFKSLEQYRVWDREVLSITPDQGIGRVRVTWIDSSSKKQWACDWMYKMTLDSDNRCTSFQEWHVVGSKD